MTGECVAGLTLINMFAGAQGSVPSVASAATVAEYDKTLKECKYDTAYLFFFEEDEGIVGFRHQSYEELGEVLVRDMRLLDDGHEVSMRKRKLFAKVDCMPYECSVFAKVERGKLSSCE